MSLLSVERIVAETKRLAAVEAARREEEERPAREEAARRAQRKAWVLEAINDPERPKKAKALARNALKMISKTFPRHSPEDWMSWQLVRAVDEMEDAIRVKYGLFATIDNFADKEEVAVK